MKKKVTIDTLAQMTAEQFSKVDERFDKVDERLDNMETRFEARFDKVDERLDKMDATLKTVLDVVLEIPSKKAFNRLENKVESIDIRLTSVERKVGSK